MNRLDWWSQRRFENILANRPLQWTKGLSVALSEKSSEQPNDWTPAAANENTPARARLGDQAQATARQNY